jgi:hypothetical protein
MLPAWGVIATGLALALGGCFDNKEAMLAACKVRAMEIYKPQSELSQDSRASEYVFNCMIAAGYQRDSALVACYGHPTIVECFK